MSVLKLIILSRLMQKHGFHEILQALRRNDILGMKIQENFLEMPKAPCHWPHRSETRYVVPSHFSPSIRLHILELTNQGAASNAAGDTFWPKYRTPMIKTISKTRDSQSFEPGYFQMYFSVEKRYWLYQQFLNSVL